MKDSKPLLSIVIANYNYGRFLEEAIKSVLSQSCQDFELIICDGGSSDESVEIIRKYAEEGSKSGAVVELRNSKISYWVSEPDKGQSAAFNKGFSHARGRFLTWLNADDVMLPGTIEKLQHAVAKLPQQEWFVGGCFWLDPHMRIIRCCRGRPFSEIRYREGDVNVSGPSSFFSKRLFESVGGIDERFKLSMDSDLWMRFAYREHARFRVFADYAWGLRLHPDAKMSGHNFTPAGKFDTHATGRDPEQFRQKMVQLRREYQWTRESAFAYRKGSALTRLMSVAWGPVLLGRLETKRWAGEHYQDYFK